MVSDDVVAVLGGIDITSNGSIPILEHNDLPYVGGIPINLDEERSPISFQFSGGMAGAFTAFAQYAADELHAEHISIAYAEYPPIQTAAQDYGVTVAEDLGIDDVREVPFGLSNTDFLPVLQQASDAIITIDMRQHVVFLNRAAEQVFGVAAHEALGQPLDRFIPQRQQMSCA